MSDFESSIRDAVFFGGFPDKGERLLYLDNLKIIAAFAVVMTHIASIGWQVLSVNSWQWFATSVFEIATRFCVPVFFMCSGALLLNPHKCIQPRALAVRYVGKTMVIALVVSLLFVLLQYTFLGWQGWRALLRATLDGPYFIWYLWVLVGLYALTPILKVVAKDEKLLGYSVLVLLFFTMFKSTCNAMIPESEIAIWLNNFILFADGAEGVFYYLVGAWLCSHTFSRAASKAIYCIGIAALIAAILLNYRCALQNGWDLYYVNRDNILIALYSTSVFLFVKNAMAKDYVGGATFAKKAVSCGLLIYLAHPFFRLIMESCDAFSFFVDFMLLHPCLGITMVTTGVYFLSFGTALALKFASARVVSFKRR